MMDLTLSRASKGRVEEVQRGHLHPQGDNAAGAEGTVVSLARSPGTIIRQGRISRNGPYYRCLLLPFRPMPPPSPPRLLAPC